MSTPLQTSSVELPSHCIVTVTTGTNYPDYYKDTDSIARQHVQTQFALRFSGAYPLAIKGVKEENEFVGFSMVVSGPDEAEQLIKALEAGASQLRLQAQLPLEPTEPVAIATKQLADAEHNIIWLLAMFGGQQLPNGLTAAGYLAEQISIPLVTPGYAELWSLGLRGVWEREPLELAWFHAHADAAGVAILGDLEKEQKYSVPPHLFAGLENDEAGLQQSCDDCLTGLGLARINLSRVLLEQEFFKEITPDERAALTRRYLEFLKLESQLTKLLAAHTI